MPQDYNSERLAKSLHSYINNYTKPGIPISILEEWQEIVELVARLAGVRAGLIMEVQDTEIEVLAASKKNNNPFVAGEKTRWIDSGLYCEKVIRQGRELLVPNALKMSEWQNNPDLQYNLNSYLGFPIKLPNEQIFGTICLLDDKENYYSEEIIKLMEKMRNLIESHLRLLLLSLHDYLTGLYNRAFMDLKIGEEINRIQRYHVPSTILIIDIDHFKKVNDKYGHAVGDEVLKNLARIITDYLRCADIASRYGGEEFVVLMPGTSMSNAIIGAERIRTEIEKSSLAGAGEVTVSIGAAEYRFGETSVDWFNRADAALYEAKNSGKNRVAACSQPGINSSAVIQLQWKNEWNSGNEKIDREHREMIEMGFEVINLSFAGQGQDEIMTQLEILLDYIAQHFEHEEEILKEIGYPELAEHQKIHQELIDKTLHLKKNYASSEVKNSLLFSFVFDDVIVGHLEEEDTKFFSYTSKS